MPIFGKPRCICIPICLRNGIRIYLYLYSPTNFNPNIIVFVLAKKCWPKCICIHIRAWKLYLSNTGQNLHGNLWVHNIEGLQTNRIAAYWGTTHLHGHVWILNNAVLQTKVIPAYWRGHLHCNKSLVAIFAPISGVLLYR